MSDIFETVASKYKNTPSAVILFVAAFVMLAIGANHFLEDTFSSYMGLVSVEQHFNMNVQIFDWTYWTMSVAPQIASVVFFYIYLANTSKGWALWASFVSQAADFLADLWYRSNGSAFSDWGVTVASAIITFAFFTLGSEVFITVGSGLCIKLAAPALHSWGYFRSQVDKVKKAFQNGNIGKNYQDEGSNQSNRVSPTAFSTKKGSPGNFRFPEGKKSGLHSVNKSMITREFSDDDTKPVFRD